MPNRVLREGILTSDKVNCLNWQEEVFYRRLMSVVDDFGRYTAHPKLLRAALYPLALDRVSDADIEKWMLVTAEAALVSVYTARDGKRYIELINFRQQVRAAASKWPARDEQMPSGCAADAQQALSRCSADAQRMRSESETESETKTEACGTAHTHAGEGSKGIDWTECLKWSAADYAADFRQVRPEYGRIDDGPVLQALQMETDQELRARAYCDWKAADLGSIEADRKPQKSLRAFMRNARRFPGRGAGPGGTCDPATDTREVV